MGVGNVDRLFSNSGRFSIPLVVLCDASMGNTFLGDYAEEICGEVEVINMADDLGAEQPSVF